MTRYFVLMILLLAGQALQSQIIARFEIISLPSGHVPGTAIYLAGSFNDWNPNKEEFRFRQDEKSNYFLELNLEPGKYEYKLTRGGWDKVECRKGGESIGNRQISVTGNSSIEIAVQEWADNAPAITKTSTAGKNVKIIDTAFHIDQLNRKRRIWIYLPEGYASSKTRYPVLYMHDGQNVFDRTTSYAGEWGVDECLDSMRTKCIVVAIDNGGDKRMNEYSPYDFSLREFDRSASDKTYQGEGALYVDFLVKKLKPFIDKKYRTLKGRSNTMIAGSSMGGLISMYGLLRYPKVFGGAGVFSPAFWIAPNLLEDVRFKGKKVNARIYFYAGKQESESMVSDMLKVFEGMMRVSSSKMTTVIRDDGKHNEPTWRREFPLFYEWILR